MAQRATASGERIFQLLDRAGADRAGRRARAPRRAAAHVRFEGVTMRYDRAAAPVLTDVDLEFARRATVALVGATGVGQDDPRGARRAPLRPVRRARADRRRRRARRSTSRRCGAAVAVTGDDPFLFSTTRAREHRLRAPGGDPRGGARTQRAARRRTSSSSGCPRATTPASASAGCTLSGGQRQRHRDRARAPRRPADPDPRRRDVVGRRDDRARDQARARAR